MKRITLLVITTMLIFASASQALAISPAAQKAELRALAVRAENSSLRYVHTTWFRKTYKYKKITVSSLTEATGTAGSTATIEVLRPAKGYVGKMDAEVPVRTEASALYATALSLHNGTYNASRVGVSQAEARRRVIAMVNAIVISHSRDKWHRTGQSALWMYYTAAGAQLVWDDLPNCTQQLVYKAVADEADRLVKKPPPYYKYASGKVKYKGDSKSEENAWNATLLFLAARMWPEKPNAAAWEAQGKNYALNSYTTPSQVGTDPRIIGSNIEPNGAVINHSRVHPDYMITAGEMWSKYALVAAWTSTELPYEYNNGQQKVWWGLTGLKFSPHGYKAPGGTIFRRNGRAYTSSMYYPKGTDWAKTRRHNAVIADVSQFYKGNVDGYNWGRKHLHYVIGQQARHKDGRIMSPGESNFTEEEQFGAACLAESVELLSHMQ